MTYVDGFVLPVKKKGLKTYQKLAKKAGKVWMDHGALQYVETIAEDMKNKWGVTFPKMAKPKKDEVIAFSYIVFKSRKHRDTVNKAVMKDKRMDMKGIDMQTMPMDCKRMAYGGFKTIVEM